MYMPSIFNQLDDHPVSLVAGFVTVAGVYVLTPAVWYTALIAGMIVSGVLEFAIKEVPPDTDEYDPEQYPLWAAADSGDAPTDGRNTDSTDDALSTLQERYASGELNDAEFEDKVERLLESDRDDAQSHLEEDSVMEELEK
jgi:hypothetical protein